MKNTNDYLEELIVRYPNLSACKRDIWKAYEIMADSYKIGGKILIAGNGGSASDAEHMVGELMKSFVLERKIPDCYRKRLIEENPEIGNFLSERLQEGLAAMSLVNQAALSTAYHNDVDGSCGFAQQVYGYGKKGDVFFGITTSGNSQNIVYAHITAKAKGLKTISLTGKNGGKVKGISDVSIIVPEEDTYKIQELHLPIYHCLCLMLENYFFGGKTE